MIELIDRSSATRPDAFVSHRMSWRRTAEVFWILLNASAMIEGRLGSLDSGGLSEDDRRLRTLSRQN